MKVDLHVRKTDVPPHLERKLRDAGQWDESAAGLITVGRVEADIVRRRVPNWVGAFLGRDMTNRSRYGEVPFGMSIPDINDSLELLGVKQLKHQPKKAKLAIV